MHLLTLSLCIPLLASGNPVQEPEAPSEPPPVTDVPRPEFEGAKRYYKREYEFTSNWFTHNLPYWHPILEPFKGKPDVHYLEVGLYEGRSAIWMLE